MALLTRASKDSPFATCTSWATTRFATRSPIASKCALFAIEKTFGRSAMLVVLVSTVASSVPKPTGGRVFHYGYVRPPEEMARKSTQFSFFYRGESLSQLPPPDLDAVDPWSWDLRSCRPYHGSHPALMSTIIANKHWHIDFQYTPWYRNPAWWNGFLRKNFSSLFRWFEKRKQVKSETAGKTHHRTAA